MNALGLPAPSSLVPIGLILVAAVIRVIGIGWGGPYDYHPDEWITAMAAGRPAGNRRGRWRRRPAGHNLAPGTTIIREQYTPQPPLDRYDVGVLPALWVRSIDWYQANQVDVLIASDALYARFDERSPIPRAAYARLLDLPVLYRSPGGLAGPMSSSWPCGEFGQRYRLREPLMK